VNVEWIRKCCLAFPHVTEHAQWECLVCKVGGKIFAVAPFEPSKAVLSFKVTPEDFAELTEMPGIIQAPYFARGQWVALESEDALPAAEIKKFLRKSYDLVVAKLPKKVKTALS
jgi:predicted DNA-binding protein (MmcQ/YjbR family)